MKFRDQDGARLNAICVVGRADAIHFVSNDYLYRVDVQAAIGQYNEG
jgi:hypothetical protein